MCSAFFYGETFGSQELENGKMKKQVARNYVAKHAREHQRATVMKDRKREAKKTGQHGKRRLTDEAPFFCLLFLAYKILALSS